MTFEAEFVFINDRVNDGARLVLARHQGQRTGGIGCNGLVAVCRVGIMTIRTFDMALQEHQFFRRIMRITGHIDGGCFHRMVGHLAELRFDVLAGRAVVAVKAVFFLFKLVQQTLRAACAMGRVAGGAGVFSHGLCHALAAGVPYFCRSGVA